MEAVAFIGIEFPHRDAVVGEDFGGQDERGVLEFLEGGEFAESAFRDADDEDNEAEEAGEEGDPENANGFTHSILIVRSQAGFRPAAGGFARGGLDRVTS